MAITKNENQMPLGTWGKLSTIDTERLPKVIFEINIPVKVTFKTDEPHEFTGNDGGAFYIFDVKEGEVDKVISTSAWTLLRGIKANAPLTGKTLEIVKKLVKGKQNYEVKSV